MSSRLFQTIREKEGLAYSIYSFNSSLEKAGIFGIHTSISPNKKTKTLESAIPVVKISAIKLKKVPKTKRGATSQPLQLIGLINKELPSTVRKNMQSPALQNQTGRFASSVRVTDIVQTPKGFPSIGYTYQKNPYQVFENTSAGPWSNGERDPRDLIDKSIREIAIQFAIGRFYTRRV